MNKYDELLNKISKKILNLKGEVDTKVEILKNISHENLNDECKREKVEDDLKSVQKDLDILQNYKSHVKEKMEIVWFTLKMIISFAAVILAISLLLPNLFIPTLLVTLVTLPIVGTFIYRSISKDMRKLKQTTTVEELKEKIKSLEMILNFYQDRQTKRNQEKNKTNDEITKLREEISTLKKYFETVEACKIKVIKEIISTEDAKVTMNNEYENEAELQLIREKIN